MVLFASHRQKMTAFFVGYVAVFVALALFGYYAISPSGQWRVAHKPQTFATDLAYYDLPRMTLAVGTGANKAHVRMDISLEVAKKDIPILDGYKPIMTDKLNGYFIKMRPDQIAYTSSISWLRREMLAQINSVGAPIPVHDLLFRQLILM